DVVGRAGGEPGAFTSHAGAAKTRTAGMERTIAQRRRGSLRAPEPARPARLCRGRTGTVRAARRGDGECPPRPADRIDHPVSALVPGTDAARCRSPRRVRSTL